MTYRINQIIITFVLCVVVLPYTLAIQVADTYRETCRLLLKIESLPSRDEALATLFQVGDERIQDLIKALNDQNVIIRRNAQVIIRYLGSDDGMKALFESYKNPTGYSEAGPVPLPLRDWDYERIRRHYLTKFNEWDQRATSYIYALALDESPNTINLLSELNKKAEQGMIPYHYALQRVKAIKPNLLLTRETDIAKLVVDNAFFINPDDRNHTSSKLIGFNNSKNKALLKVFVNGGPIETELYHVVLQKQGEAWKFYSVTLISVS